MKQWFKRIIGNAKLCEEDCQTYEDHPDSVITIVKNDAALGLEKYNFENPGDYSTDEINELVQQNRQLSCFNNILSVINRQNDLSKILKDVVFLLKEYFDGLCMIHLWDAKRKSLTLKAASFDRANFTGYSEITKDDPYLGNVIKTRQPFFSEDIGTNYFDEVLSAVKWFCCVPLKVKQKFGGVLTIASNQADEIISENKAFFKQVAEQIAIAIENGRVREQRKRKYAEIEKKNQELQSFVYTVSHDLKSPLVSLYGFSELLNEKFDNQFDAEAQDYLKHIIMSAEIMHRMVDDLLELSRIGRVLGPRTKFSTKRLLEEQAAVFEYQMAKKNITLHYPSKMPIIYADRERIATVFQNLINNAVKYSKDDGNAIIEVDWREENGHYVFRMKDNGIGIDQKNHERIFDLFQKGNHNGMSGTGIGLTITRKILEHHGGKIWLESEPGSGAAFYFTLPKYSRRRRNY